MSTYKKLGDVANGNFTEFEVDGTMTAHGEATCFRDELSDLIKGASQNPSSNLVYNYEEGTLDFEVGATINDWAIMNVQLNHDWLPGSEIEPHIHWFQESDFTPNWLIQYRWQPLGELKENSWTSVIWDTNAFSYISGTTVQITSFGMISPPSNFGEISDIVQFRILRDNKNDSALFEGDDPYDATAGALSFDVHIQVNTLGSRSSYSK